MQADPAISVFVRRRFPLSIHLSVLFSALVLAAGVAIAWLGYVQNRDLALTASDEVFARIGQETQVSLRATLEPVASFAELLALQPVVSAGTLDKRLDGLPVMRRILQSGAPIAAAYVGYEDGGFFLLRPLRSEAERRQFLAPPNGAWLVQSVEVDERGSAQGQFLFFDTGLRELGRRVPGDDKYDPRVRPWYRLATQPGRRILTEPYAFFATGSPGVTVALRTGRGSVIGIDVTLESIAGRLEALRSVPGMQIVLFDETRRVLASAEPSHAVVRRSDGTLSLATLDALGEPSLAGLQPVPDGETAIASRVVEVAGRAWRTAVLPVSTVRGPVSLGVAAPLDVLLTDARAIRNRGLLAALAVLLAVVPFSWWVARRVASSLDRITREAQDIRHFRFDGPTAGSSLVLEIDQLSAAMDMMRATIRRFLDITGSLAAETDFKRLLDRMVRETSSSTDAAGGAIYLVDPARDALVVASSTLASGEGPGVAPAQEPLEANTPVAAAFRSNRTTLVSAATSPVRASGSAAGAQASVAASVAIPLRDRDGERLGVLALYARGGEALTPEQIAFAEALSGTAAVAIETQRLLEARKALLDSFIRLVAGAIDSKSPYTGGHCQRVPELTMMLARAACDAKHGPLAEFRLSDDDWEALHIASWLHDCGKVTTPEYVVDKATKLETITDRIHEVRMRFEVLKRDAEIEYWQAVADGADRDGLRADLQRKLTALDDEFAFVAACNEGGEFLDQARIDRLHTIAVRRWMRTLDDRLGISHEERLRKQRVPPQALPVAECLLADKPEHVIERDGGAQAVQDNPWGFRMRVPELAYNRGELHNLAVKRGTLTEEERYTINHHIVQTIVMLSQLPFPRHLKTVPEIAGGHHEKMDGTGYPRGLRRDDMSWTARMMAIADIFEALTAADRPYKKGKTLSEALRIMDAMRRDQHIDPDLFELFLSAGIYREYAQRFLRPEQIDAVDAAQYLGDRARAGV